MVRIEEIMDWLELMTNISMKQHWEMDMKSSGGEKLDIETYMCGYLLGQHSTYSGVLAVMTAYMCEKMNEDKNE